MNNIIIQVYPAFRFHILTVKMLNYSSENE